MTRTRFKRPLRYVMSAFFTVAGVLHFVAPSVYVQAVPPQFPNPVGLVYLSGIAEVLLGIGLLFRRTRRVSAWGIIALLIAIFPANVYMATSDLVVNSVPTSLTGVARVATWVRLPLQGILVLWAWWYTSLEPSE